MKILTWNIQWGRGADGRVDLARMLEHAKRFCDFDVLCLQEVASGFADLPGADGSDQFAEIAARCPGFFAVDGVAVDVAGSGPTRKRKRFGNMILAGYPVLQVLRYLLPWPAEAGVKSMQRIALEVNLDTPGGPLRIVTTHLEYYSAAQRLAQVEALRRLHQEACRHALAASAGASEGGPFSLPPRARSAVLTGDFNFREHSPEYLRLTAAHEEDEPAYCDAWPLAHPGKDWPATLGVHDKRQWPEEGFPSDFIFVTADLVPRLRRVEVDDVTDASDHQPLMIELA